MGRGLLDKRLVDGLWWTGPGGQYRWIMSCGWGLVDRFWWMGIWWMGSGGWSLVGGVWWMAVYLEGQNIPPPVGILLQKQQKTLWCLWSISSLKDNDLLDSKEHKCTMAMLGV